MIERVVIITRKTALEELIERFNSREQARFYLEHSGGSIEEYEAAHDQYHRSLDTLRRQVPARLRAHVLERGYLPNYLFGDSDLVVTVGPDGLVVNTAKYLARQPILAVNPDPARIDGVLTPFSAAEAGAVIERAMAGRAPLRAVSMAEARLADGQTLLGFNDLFIGPRNHASARYSIEVGGQVEIQSSSGIIISTPAGSTGWLQALVNGALQLAGALTGEELRAREYRLPWETERLRYTVREPFLSRTSQTSMVFGELGPGQVMTLRSLMPEDGVIFSDGLQQDYLGFNSGSVATVRLADRKAWLISR